LKAAGFSRSEAESDITAFESMGVLGEPSEFRTSGPDFSPIAFAFLGGEDCPQFLHRDSHSCCRILHTLTVRVIPRSHFCTGRSKSTGELLPANGRRKVATCPLM